VVLASRLARGEEPYRERWRPQLHFSPAKNWMNDPNGMVFHDGEYHLFYQYNPFGDRWGHMSWGHAVSRDLVHWEHLPLALAEESGVMIFSGSAVVDWRNTSGFGADGKPPLVAIYTGHYTERRLQNQHLAYSTDRGRTWTKHPGNPVLDIGEADFRDPKVFWHEPQGRWVMVVAWPVRRQVRFYASEDLKSWRHLSDFGPAGSTTGIWECPDLFPVSVEGTGRGERWVLVVNVGSGAPAGGSGSQYFAGEFDGERFTLHASFPKPEPEIVPEGKVLADFEGDDYGAWRVSGAAFGASPARGTLPGQQAVDGFRGRGLVNTFRDGDRSEGTLTSPEIEIDRGYLSFLIGGGAHEGRTCINLLVGGDIVRTAAGDDAEQLRWKSWDVRDLRGKKGTLEIVDRHTGGWGHINIDHIVLADLAARAPREAALWADRGRDFYAAVSWSDVPAADGRRLWLSWMSNWEYAQDVPTSPWRSAMSLPRELTLREVSGAEGGLRLVQRPVRELEALRREGRRLSDSTLEGANSWLEAKGPVGDLLEVSLAWSPGAAGGGVEVASAPGEFVSVTWDGAHARWRLDRSRAGRSDFHRRFAAAFEAPGTGAGDLRRLRLLLDSSSIEAFLDDGATVFTALFFPSTAERRITLTGDPGASVKSLEVWALESVWAKP
jgi:sucrose-6-phosphate hydrolase SacC (GH32 family)